MDIKKLKDISNRFTEIYKKYDEIVFCEGSYGEKYELFQNELKQLFSDLVDIWGILWL